jgi:hypothetical protein
VCQVRKKPFPHFSVEKGRHWLSTLVHHLLSTKADVCAGQGRYSGFPRQLESGRGLQLRDSAGLGPAFPLGPLASERQGTLTVAVIWL